MRNRYSKSSRISEAKIHEVAQYLSTDLTAMQAAKLSGLNRGTINRIYRAPRERIQLAREARRPFFGVVECDESWFS